MTAYYYLFCIFAGMKIFTSAQIHARCGVRRSRKQRG